MRCLVGIIAVALVACGGDGSTPAHDAAPNDGVVQTDGASDAGAQSGVACGDPSTTCMPPQVCCDVMVGTDQCIAASSTCSGSALACDGPEDCPSTQECCLFPDRSQCLDNGICGTTGVITEVMCHVDGDCDMAAGEHCCGTAPGPLVDIYGVCRVGGCPQ